jgi:hypothetical protein
MTLEISDCTSCSSEFEIRDCFFETNSQAPKGISSITDSIHIHPVAPKPNFIQRFVISLSLVFFHMVTWTVQLTNWILKNIFGVESRQKILYRELHQISKEGDAEKIEKFLEEHSEDSFAAGYLFSEFSDLPELYPYLPRILEGANMCLAGDRGFFCRRWREYPDAYQRISSHKYQCNECYAIGHFLFWLDPEGNTRFQFENSPLRGFFSAINHCIDFLKYKRDNEQQGPTGTSSHTEHYCIRIEIDPTNFILRKLN